jgi:hypothetical protein
MHTHKLKLVFALAVASTGAQAQMVSRCVDADGTVTFSDSPCPASAKRASVRMIKINKAPTANQVLTATPDGNLKVVDAHSLSNDRKQAAEAASTHVREQQAEKEVADRVAKLQSLARAGHQAEPAATAAMSQKKK